MLAHPLAQPDKGSGIAMICTFGDVTDIIWWRELDLPNRTILGQDGRVIAEAPDAITTDAAQAAYAELAGKTVFSAKKRVVELLQESGELIGDPKPFTHVVKFYEKGDRPLEIVSTRQWYLRNGARDEQLRDASSPSAARCRGTPTSCGCASRTGRTASPATGSCRVSASSACRSRSGTRSTRTATATSTASSCRRPRSSRSTPPPTCPTATPPTSAACPAASRARTTSSTPGRPRR